MQTIFRKGGYRFFFYSDEHLPLHIHVEKNESYARIEIVTLRVTDQYRIGPKELRKVVKMVEEHRELIKEHWHEHFGTARKD
jgi:hypothetical protein